MERFKNSRSRTQRAADHARTFAMEWDAIFTKSPPVPSLTKDKNSGWFVLSTTVPSDLMERIRKNLLPLELGELAYQLRAALDGLIWDAITYTQGSEPPSDEANRLEFPILNGRNRHFKKCGLYKSKLPHHLKHWLAGIQPDSAEKAIGDPDRGLKGTLEDIHNLARLDRHRRMRIIATVPIIRMLDVTTTPFGGFIKDRIDSPCDLLSGQEEVARFRIVCAGGLVPYEVRLKAGIAFDIKVEDVELHYGENIGVQLNRFIQAVERVIERFDAEFI